MKKMLIAIFVCTLLTIGMFPIAGTILDIEHNNNNQRTTQTVLISNIEDAILCSAPIPSSIGESCSIKLEEATTYTKSPGQPVLPVITKTYMFPIGTTISQVSCSPIETYEMHVEREIRYASHPVPCGSSSSPTIAEKDASIYGSSDFYPATWCDTHIGVGLDGGKRVTYATVQLFPVRYSPQQNLIRYVEQIDLQIQLQPPEQPMIFNDAYDLLIIAPQTFENDLQRLVDHKEAMGLRTNLVTTEEIYSTYQGRDEQEQIKYCIKHAIEQWNITYVLLFGGMKGQRYWSWHVPVRYSHVSPTTSFGPKFKFVTDLYYADIYKYDDVTGYTFDDWDADGDNIFSEWKGFANKDVMDLYPDVYIGRLPCRYKKDVDTVIDRIITYETTTYGDDWFRRIAVAGGDTYLESNYGVSTDFDEGKEMTAYALNFMPDFEHIRLWTDGDGDIEYNPENILDVLSQGHGFFLYSGHGSPSSIATHPHGDDSIWIGVDTSDIKSLNNEEKLPIYVLSDCDNCQFNVSILNFLQGFKNGFEYPFLFAETVPYCLGWFVSYLETGGAIASLGVTCLGLNLIGDDNDNGICDIVEGYDGWMHTHYFKVDNQSVDTLGQVFGQTITDYLHQFPINWRGMANTQSHYDVTVIQNNELIGDPSLKIGGYP